MRAPRRALWLVGAWLAATAATAAVALAVVGLAGEQVGDDAIRPLTAVQVEALGVGTVAPETTAAVTSAVASTTTADPASATTTTQVAATDATGTTAAPATTAAPGTTEAPLTTVTVPTTVTTMAEQAQIDSRQVTGGTVVVRWTATSVELVSASPVDGYTVEVKERGPGKVEVEFEGGGARTKYRAEVSDGRLDVEVSVEDEND